MDYAIIAAGEGHRLLQEGVTLSKPFIKVDNTLLVNRLIDIFYKNRMTSLSIIVNDKMAEVVQYIKSLQLTVPINGIVKTTPSSMHSFFELSPFLKKGKCCITTIDTVFKEDAFASFVQAFETSNASIDGMMAVTHFIDDEKPLYVVFNEKTFIIEQFSDYPISQYISGGIYCLTPRAIELLPFCIKKGASHMRNFQHQLLKNQFTLKAYPLGKIIDIDHASDIKKANSFLKKKKNYSSFQIVGVTRSHQYSPNHIDNDTAIFHFTTEQLKKKGCKIIIYSEKEFQSSLIHADLIFTMARHFQSIYLLKKLEDTGKKVVNSGYGIENCTRENITKLLLAHHIPLPQSCVVPTHNFYLSDLKNILGTHCWIKRGDCHSLQREDVSYVNLEKEAINILHKYALRGIQSAVINEHLPGDLIKFYGVAKTNFFYWFYPDKANSKFGLETINGKVNGVHFDQNLLKKICAHIAQLLEVPIYGGDCIIDTNGEIKIIDFNDWPSFAPCQQQAAFHIAEFIFNQLS